jgi:tetratricopeptide (TPR) repeat protein
VTEDAAAGPVAEFCAALRQLRFASCLDPVTLARQLSLSRTQLYAILNGEIKRPPDWDKVVRPLVDACTGGDPVALAHWRRRHAVLVEVAEDLRRRDRRRRPARLPGAHEALPPEIRYSLPPDIAGFTGRDEELDCITAAVADAARTSGVVAIHAVGGMPGIGKTTLAVRVAHLLRDRFPDRQLFIDLRGHTPGQDPVAPAAALASLLTAVGVDARYLPGDMEGRVGLWRDRMAGQRAVLVLDNAAGSAQVAPLLPGGEGCLVLVTSRRYLGDLPGAVVPVLLGPLPPDQAQAMFLRLAPRAAASASAVTNLVRLAGCLPLAISLLARVYSRHPCWTLADLTSETRASLLTLAAEKDSVAAVFEVSCRYLPPGQGQFFRRLGLYPGHDIDGYAAAALAGTSLQEAGGYLDALHSEGLLTEVGYRRYGMHDLIRQYARDRAAGDPAADRDQALGRLLDYYQHTAAIAQARLARQPRTGDAAGVLPVPPASVPDLRDSARALAWARTNRASLLACLDHVTRTRENARILALTAAVAALLRQDGPWTEAITRHATAAQAARRLGDRPGEANALYDLGVVRQLTGDYLGATETLEAALRIYRDSGDRLGEANALYDLGVVRWLTGDFPGAPETLEAALRIYRNLSDPLGEASALKQLAVVAQYVGDHARAADALEKMLRIHPDLRDQLDEPHALNYVRLVRQQAGAVKTLETALRIYRAPGDQLSKADALNFLGGAQWRAGDYTGAAETLEQALRLYRDLGDRLAQASILDEIGVVLREAGDYAGAATALQDALHLARELGHRGAEAEFLNDFGKLRLVQGHPDQAEACHRQALNLAREIGSHADQARALAGLGRCALTAGRTSSAEASFRQARDIFQRIGADVAAELDFLDNK